MAKLVPRKRRISGRGRNILFSARVSRTASRGDKAFMACVSVRQKPTRGMIKAKSKACRVGKNPRKALARALAGLARSLSHRSGAFAGVR